MPSSSAGSRPAASSARAEAERIAAEADASERILARRHFGRFLRHVRIRSDDPLNPRPVPMVPYPYQLDLAERWAVRRESNVILKRRQVGASVLLRSYCLWRAWAHGWAIGYYSRGQDESVAWLNGVEAMIADLPPFLGLSAHRSGDFLTIGSSGSIRAFPGTQRAGISYTFQCIVADEAAHHTYGRENYANYGPAIGAGGQFICLSTADPALGPTGWFHEMVEQARSGGPYAFVFIDRWTRPDQQTEWWERESARYTDDQTRSANYPERPEDAFRGREGLVYPEFDRERHFRDIPPVPWDWASERRWASDYGGGDPSALVRAGVWQHRDDKRVPRVHIYGLAWWPDAPATEDLIAKLGEWSGDEPWTQGEGDPAPGGEVINESIRRAGFVCRRAHAARGQGMDIVRMFLARGWLTFDAKLEQFAREFANYRWRPQTDPNSRENYATRTPVDHHGDSLDALRYLLVGVWRDWFGSENAYGVVFDDVIL